MKYTPLGLTGLDVSRACLGTMTWGRQNTQADADAQIDYALDQGVNFIDTAELYAVPPRPETYGKTEIIIGDWLSRHPQKREKIILATKIAGSGPQWIRGGGPITGEGVITAVDASLQRLQTDYIDLYQLHWPNRQSPHFGKHWPNRLPVDTVDARAEEDGILDTLRGLEHCIKVGKIRHCGLSDDTPWGIATYLRLAKEHNLPRMASIQNEFNLLHTKDWPHLIEHCSMEDVAYLPWSPLATGALTGKYRGGVIPPGSRWSLGNGSMSLFRNTPEVHAAVEQYCELAKKHHVTPAQLALMWCNQIRGVTSTIIGATSMEQLTDNLQAFEMTPDEALISDVAEVHKRFPAPF